MVKPLSIAFEGLPGSGKTLISGYLRGSSMDPYVIIPEISDAPKDFLDVSSKDRIIDGNKWHLDKNIEDLKLAKSLKENGFNVGLDRTYISTLAFSKALSETENIGTFDYVFDYYKDRIPDIKGQLDVIVYFKLDPINSFRRFETKSPLCPRNMRYFHNKKFLTHMSEYFDEFIESVDDTKVFRFDMNDAELKYENVLNSLKKSLGNL